MYRIRMADGSEAAYATVEEFSVAVQEGRVPNTAEIYHQRAEKWLAIAAHPHFKAALEQSGKRPAVRVPAHPSTPGSNGATAPKIPAHPSAPTNGSTTAPRIPSVQPSTHSTVPRSIADSGSRPALHRNGAKPQLAPELMRLAAAAAAPSSSAAPAPTPPAPTVASAPAPAAPPTAPAPAAPSAPARVPDAVDSFDLLPADELPPAKPAFSPPSKPKAVSFRASSPAIESPLNDLHPLEPEPLRAEAAAPPAAPAEPVTTNAPWQLEGLPLVEMPEPGPLPYVADHPPAISRAPAPPPAPIVVAPVAPTPVEKHEEEDLSVPTFHSAEEQPVVHAAPKSKRGLLMVAGIAAVLVIAVSAFLLRPSGASPANAESLQVSTSAAQQVPPTQPTEVAPTPTPPPQAEPTVAKTARVEPALKADRPATRNRVDPTPTEAANEGDGEVVPVARLPMPAAIDANIKTGVDSAGPTLIDRSKALEAARKAIVDKDR